MKPIRTPLLFTLLLTLFILIAAPPADAFQQQEKANFELAEDWTSDKMRKLAGSTGLFPRWLEDQDRFWYTHTGEEGTHYWFVDAEEREKRPLFDRREMAARLTGMFDRTWNHLDLGLDNLTFDEDKELFTFRVDSFQVEYNHLSNELVRGDTLRDDEEPDERWASYSPDSSWIAFARNHNLYLMEADDPDSTEYQLTDSGERWYSFQADEEDTNSTDRQRAAVRWFDDSSKFWVKRQDVRKVEDLWVINNLGDRPELETYKYPMPGDEHVPQDEIWAFDAEAREGVQLDTDREDWKDESLGGAYFNGGGIFTGESSDYLYILRRNREWDKVDVLKSNTSTGETQVLWTENSHPYFNTRYAQLAILNEGEDLVWFSERTGWGQFYLYDGEGNLQNRITQGYFTAGDIVKIDTARSTLFFEGFGREEGVNPYHAQLYRVNLDGSGMQRLTPEAANHNISESDAGNYFVDTWSTVTTAPKSVLRDDDGRVILELEESSLDRLREAGWKAPETFTVKADDDATDIHGVMWKPFDFDSTKSYPIISYVYPGPQTEPFPTSFSLSSQTSLAQLGFVVVAMGNRGGHPARSKYYHNYGHGNLRDYPLADNRYGIEQLASRHPWIDKNRVGIYGHSGGGFMSTAAMLQHPDFYDVAVSSAGNHDNNIYNIWWGEVHNGVTRKTRTVKVENEDGEMVDSTEVYFDGTVDANHDLAENLEGHLMLAHGTIDNNVHPANTMRMVNALIAAGKRFDLVMLPGQRHGFGRYNDYFERVRWGYFAEHLLGDYRTEVDMYLPD